MSRRKKTEPAEEHLDFLGQPIKVGDRVVTYRGGQYSGLGWGTVEKLNPKMIRVKRGNSKGVDRRYGQDVIVMSEDQEQALAWQRLKNA